MRGLYDATPFDLLPEYLKDPEEEAVCYAVGEALKKLLDYMEGIALYGNLEKVSDEVLNSMALELRTQYYDTGAARKTREDMVKQTLSWYMRGGTNSTLEEYLATLYDGGHVEEWHEYGGKPYYFKSKVTVGENEVIEVGETEEIIRRIHAYKNVRSWLEALILQILFKVNVNIQYDLKNRLYMEFFPRQNLEPLLLDSTWVLDGIRKLNGYRSGSQVDFYPVKIKLFMSNQITLLAEESDVCIEIFIPVMVFGQEALKLIMEFAERIRFTESLKIQTEAEVTGNIEAGMYRKKYLDGMWKLDGSRKLNGGKIML